MAARVARGSKSVRTSRKCTSELMDELKQRRAQGQNYQKIAAEMKINPDTASKWDTDEWQKSFRSKLDAELQRRAMREARRLWRKKNQAQAIASSAKAYAESKHESVTYFIGCDAAPDLVLIGRTISLRTRMIHYHAKSFVPIKLLGVTTVPEAEVHELFRKHRINPRREMFKFHPDIKKFIEDTCNVDTIRLGYDGRSGCAGL